MNLVAQICFDKRSTEFKYLKIKEMYTDNVKNQILFRFDAPVQSQTPNITELVRFHNGYDSRNTIPSINDIPVSPYDDRFNLYNEMANITEVTLSESKRLLVAQLEVGQSSRKADGKLKFMAKWIQFEDDVTYYLNGEESEQVFKNMSFYSIELVDTILKYLGWMIWLCMTVIFFKNLIRNFFFMRPYVKFFQVLRIVILTQSTIPSNFAAITDFLRKSSIFEIIPGFLLDFSFLKSHFRCSADEILHKAGYNCSFFNNILPLMITFLVFLLGVFVSKYVLLILMKPTLTVKQRRELLRLKKKKMKLGLRGSIDSADLLKNMPELLENDKTKSINDGLYWISTHRFWYYLMDYLMVEIYFILLIALKNVIELFKYGKIIGKIDIFVNFIAIYYIYMFFKWKFLLIRKLKMLRLKGIEVRKSADSSVSSSLDSVEVAILTKKKDEEEYYFKWVFILEEFSYKFKPKKVLQPKENEPEVKKDPENQMKIGGEVVENPVKNEDEAPKAAGSTVQAGNPDVKQVVVKAKKVKKIKQPKDWKFVRSHQILFQDFELFALVAVLVFFSNAFWIHIPIIGLLIYGINSLGVKRFLPADYPVKLLKYPIFTILVIKFLLSFRFVSQMWIYHILGNLGSVFFIYYILKNIYHLSPNFEKRRFGMSRKDRIKSKRLNQIMQANKQFPTTKNIMEPSKQTPQTLQNTPHGLEESKSGIKRKITSKQMELVQHNTTKFKLEQDYDNVRDDLDNSKMPLRDESFFQEDLQRQEDPTRRILTSQNRKKSIELMSSNGMKDNSGFDRQMFKGQNNEPTKPIVENKMRKTSMENNFQTQNSFQNQETGPRPESPYHPNALITNQRRKESSNEKEHSSSTLGSKGVKLRPMGETGSQIMKSMLDIDLTESKFDHLEEEQKEMNSRVRNNSYEENPGDYTVVQEAKESEENSSGQNSNNQFKNF